MTPNTFEGGQSSGRLDGVNCVGGHLTAEKARNATRFANMATIAGAPSGVSSPEWLIGLAGEPVKELAWRLSSDHVPDILNSTYADAAWLTPIATLAYIPTGRGAAYRTPYGSWAGCTSMITQGFNQPGLKAWLVGGACDFAGLDLPGMGPSARSCSGATRSTHRQAQRCRT